MQRPHSRLPALALALAVSVTVAENTRAGPGRPELGDAVRSFVVGRYTLFYGVVEAGIELYRVIHSARDIGADAFDE